MKQIIKYPEFSSAVDINLDRKVSKIFLKFFSVNLRALRVSVVSVFLFLIPLVLSGCGGAQSGDNELNDIKDDIKSLNTNIWVNLMPGTIHALFITGSVEIYQSVLSDSIKLWECEVLQDGNLLYELYPDSKNRSGFITQPGPDAGNKLPFSFAGINIKKELNLDKPVSLVFRFNILNKIKKFQIPAINITKTY
jgi:hypothetical protein